MRPVRITMDAFGSYNKLTKIDFTVPTQNLFLITGDTGAGKSMIFNAILFALYGLISYTSSVKDMVDVSCQYDGANKKSTVELVFTENGKEYTVIRTRRKKEADRSGAKAEDDASADTKNSFENTVRLILPDKSEITTITEANDKIKEIVGLSKEQFMRVSMLAQGDFMKLLNDSSDNKKEVFRNLFNTGIFDEIKETLQKKAKDSDTKVQTISKGCSSAAARIIVPEEYSRSPELNGMIERIMTDKKLNITDLESLLTELEALCKDLEKSVNEGTESFKEITQKRTEAQKELNTAETLMASFDSKKKAMDELNECQEHEEEIREKKDLAVRLSAAYEINRSFVFYDSVKKELDNNISELKKLSGSLPELREKKKAAQELEKQTKDALDKQNAEYALAKDRAEKSIALLDRIGENKDKADKVRSELNKSRDEAAQAQDKLSLLENQETEWTSRCEQLSNAPDALHECQKNKEALDGLSSNFKDTEALLNKCTGYDAKLKKLEAQYQNAFEEYNKIHGEYNKAFSAYLKAQAGFLAKKLKPGCECPVCGSKSHPNPCVLPENYETFSQERIDELNAQTENARSIKEELFGELNSTNKLKDEKQKQYDQAYDEFVQKLKEMFSDISDSLAPEQAKIILDEKSKLLQNELNAKNNDVKELKALQQELSNAASRKKTLRMDIEAANKQVTELEKNLSALEAETKSLEAQKSYASKEEARNALNEARQIFEKVRNDRDTARAQCDEAVQAENEASARIDDYNEKIPGKEAKCKEYKKAYDECMEKHELAEKDWQALTEKYSEKQIREFQDAVNEFETRKAAARNVIATADEAIKGRTEPDIKKLRSRAEEAEAAVTSANTRLNELKNSLAADHNVLDELNSGAKQRAAAVKECGILNNLYDRISGKNTKGRIDIETFAQRYYMERILRSANKRFLEMSGGQYELRIAKTDSLGNSKKAGLDLVAYSNITGKEREVRTLSGGESFMAALALSFGLADTIQAQSMAVHSEIMFIDEGFGSLGDQSLDQAIRVIRQMAGGSTLIGIISHISELKNSIDNQLVITKDNSGSHAKWVIN